MFGGRSHLSSATGIPNFFPDLVVAPKRDAVKPKTATLDSLTAKPVREEKKEPNVASPSKVEKKHYNKRRDNSSSSSSGSSCDDENCSRRSSPAPRQTKRQRDDTDTQRPIEKRAKKEEGGVVTKKIGMDGVEALRANSLDVERLNRSRDALKHAYEAHGDKLKELSEIEEKVVEQRDLLERSSRAVDENMRHLMELEDKETRLLRRIEALEKERDLYDQKKIEWDALRDKIAVSFGFTKKDDDKGLWVRFFCLVTHIFVWPCSLCLIATTPK